MRHKRFDMMKCPIARSLERAGERRTILILRDALLGLARFDEFQKGIEVVLNILAKRPANARVHRRYGAPMAKLEPEAT